MSMQARTIFAWIIVAFGATTSMSYAASATDNITNTECATGAFANALADSSKNISESDDETTVRQWIYQTFAAPDVLRTVLACPEIASSADDQTITFLPIEYTFPGGRKIVVNYETQPKILRQRMALANKRDLPGDGAPNARIGADNAIWTNTDPAWYGIMVVQSGALREFVGPDKNNTISLNYIKNNIDSLYPQGWNCTSKSALANDKDVINRALHTTVGLEKDDNDYYVAGDINLQWISYAEIALDVAITAATFGGGAVVLGATKAVRASKVLKNLNNTIKALRQTESVTKYTKLVQRQTKIAQEIKTLDAVGDATKIETLTKEAEALAKEARTLEQTEQDVAKYKQAMESFAEISKYRHGLRSMKTARRGNIAVRAIRALKAANTGSKAINKGARVARASMQSGRAKDWLFQSTLRNIGLLAKMEEQAGFIYGAIQFAGELYDYTETSTGDFTNNIDFAPLLLLSADDIPGQENIVNYGMWLMWVGDSLSAADDDAAYLQAMDFAQKAYQDINELQIAEDSYPCDIDIYVVRPILRNPGTDSGEIYYLIMNDEPWTTRYAK